MRGPTLIDELRRKAKQDADALWTKARTDADAYRNAQQHAIEEQRVHDAARLTAAAAEVERAATAGAEREARRICATAKSTLADRLRALAAGALPEFRNSDYPRLFASLAEELPALAWQHVRVNPADETLAQTMFRGAAVSCDANIAGGVDASAHDGRVKVTNTLDARLDSAWPEILPDLMKEVLEEGSHSQPRT